MTRNLLFGPDHIVQPYHLKQEAFEVSNSEDEEEEEEDESCHSSSSDTLTCSIPEVNLKNNHLPGNFLPAAFEFYAKIVTYF